MIFAIFLVGSLVVTAVTGDYASEALAAHNRYRHTHNAPSLRLNSTMSASAASYARRLAQMGRLQHSGNGDGENLIFRCSSNNDPLPPTEAVKRLYDEICQYDFDNPRFSATTGHFTQLVWKASRQLGVGTAQSRDRGFYCLYVVFRYKTAGNVHGMFNTNVLKGSFSDSYCLTKATKDEPEQHSEE